MEPSVVSIVLHPAVLVASGFECLTTKQMRFLAAYRKHFTQGLSNAHTLISIEPDDLELGGILNPHGSLESPALILSVATSLFKRFPLVTQQEIFEAYYQKELSTIWQELLVELCIDIEQYCSDTKTPIQEIIVDTKLISSLSKKDIYHKVQALHRAGLGDRLLDTFRYVFSIYKASQKTYSS